MIPLQEKASCGRENVTWAIVFWFSLKMTYFKNCVETPILCVYPFPSHFECRHIHTHIIITLLTHILYLPLPGPISYISPPHPWKITCICKLFYILTKIWLLQSRYCLLPHFIILIIIFLVHKWRNNIHEFEIKNMQLY